MSKILGIVTRNLFLASLGVPGLIGACDVEALDDDEVAIDDRHTELDPSEATVSLEAVEVEIGAPEAQGESPAGGSAVNDLAQPLKADVAVGLVSEAKTAAPFVLTPPPQNTALGASWLTQQALRPVGPIGSETQYAEFRLSASELLKNSHEHIAVSLMATDQPFTAGGAWTTTAPGGGIGIALGAISSQFHPACPVDVNNSRVELAIERFGANDPNASTLVKCVSFAKTVLISAPTFKITVSTDCVASSCFAMATLRNAATNAVIASVSAPSVTRANMTRLRKVWYAVTDFDKVDAKGYSATFEVLTEDYHAVPQGGTLP